MSILPTRTFDTKTGITVVIQHEDGRDGRDARRVYLVLDGQPYSFTKSDAGRIGDQLQAFAREMREETVQDLVGSLSRPEISTVTPCVQHITPPHMHVGYVDGCAACQASWHRSPVKESR